MPFVLNHRNSGIKEKMDDPDCDRGKLFETYRQFAAVNRLLGGWRSIYKKQIKPALTEAGDNASLLDIGCGGGDILRLIHHFTMKDEMNVQFTGIDPDERAIEFTNQKGWPDNIEIKQAHSGDLVRESNQFTVVISNHLMHHLTETELGNLCSDSESLAAKLVLFSDIERSDIAYTFFRTFAPVFFRNSFITQDGLISIRRSYRRDELFEALPANWIVKRQFPFRLLAQYSKEEL